MAATTVEFFVLDVDIEVRDSQDVAVLWGITRSGDSVCCVVDPETFCTSFYFPAPTQLSDSSLFELKVRFSIVFFHWETCLFRVYLL